MAFPDNKPFPLIKIKWKYWGWSLPCSGVVLSEKKSNTMWPKKTSVSYSLIGRQVPWNAKMYKSLLQETCHRCTKNKRCTLTSLVGQEKLALNTTELQAQMKLHCWNLSRFICNTFPKETVTLYFMSENSFFKPDISIKGILQSLFMLLFDNIVWAIMMGHILFNTLKQEQKSLNSHFLVRTYTLIRP